MAKDLPNIIYLKDRNNLAIDSDSSNYILPFYKTKEYFANLEVYNSYVKEIEKLVRTDDRYNKYIAYLKNQVKLNKCQVLHNLTDDDVSIEMHHGPIFNLYDYCSIVLEYFILKNWQISTFKIANVVLDEHQRNHVQVVMLSTTIHEEVHTRNLFINYRQAHGDLNAFIKKYGIAFTEDHKEKLNRYIDKSIIYDSTDNGILGLSNKIYELQEKNNIG